MKSNRKRVEKTIKEKTLIESTVINYDKLTDSIVKAIKESKSQNEIPNINGNNDKFWARFRKAFFPKKEEIQSATATEELLKMPFFAMIYVGFTVLAILIVTNIIVLVRIIANFQPSFTNVISISGCILLLLLSCLLALMLNRIRVEIDSVKDSNYLFGLVSSITAIVSLIISIIALFKTTAS